jgi:hypothetical protein
MTECNQGAFPFEVHFSRQVVAQFDGAQMSTDGGALLLREADRKIGLLKRMARCFTDARNPERVEHELGEMLAQRIYGLALGYEDLNDHEQLRRDPLLAVVAGRRQVPQPLAGKSTLNRLELTPAGSPLQERYHKITYSAGALDTLLVEIFLEARRTPPDQIVLYIFAGDHLLCARLRPSNQDAGAGSLPEVARIVAQIRARWKQTRIILRGDSGFCREELMAWCENHAVDYVFGFARNPRLRRKIARPLREAKREHQRTGKAARVFTEFFYRTRSSWSRSRRLVAKAEHLAKGENPRFVVTSLDT